MTGFIRNILGMLAKPAPAVSGARHRRSVRLADMAALEAAIEQLGYGEVAQEIRDAARPCFHIFEAGAAADAPLGATRFGGLPDLPPDRAWPRLSDGAPLEFYAQIDLGGMEGAGGLLPGSGLLSFFALPLDGSADPVEVSVLLTPEGQALERRAPPSGAAEPWRPVAVRFEPGISFPTFDIDWMEKLELAGSGEHYDALNEALLGPSPVLGQLLGHASWSSDDLRETVYFREIGRAGQERLRIWKKWEDWEEAKTIEHKLHGGSIYRPWSARDDANMRWILDNAEAIDAGVARWQSLLTIESNAAMNLWINDANAIYFFAPAEALRRGDFSSVRAVTTQN